MPKFRFQLEALLKLRREQEKRCKEALAALVGERGRMEDELRSQDGHLKQGREALRVGLVGAVNVSLVRQQAVSTVQTQRKAHRTVLELAGLQRKIERAAAELAEAAKQRRAVEILRERRYAEWRRLVEKREQAETDEIGGARFARDPF
jgi:flagellar protein FliJ